IDEAMRLGTAFPKGPLATADDLGIDAVINALKQEPSAKPAKLLEDMVARRDLGTKTGKGFYEHKDRGGGMNFETLLISRDTETHVATIAINRPDRLNTISPQVFDELERALAELEKDEAVRCVVVTGAGDRSFSAGADLTSFSDISKAFKVWQFSRRGEEVMNRLANFSKPTLAAINGHCFGGGLELALACDFRIAAATRPSMRPSRWRRWPSASSPRRTTFTKESRPSWRSAHRSSRVRESTVPVGESLPSHRDDAFLGQGLNLPRGVSEGSKDFPGVLAFCGHPCRVARLQGRMLRGVGDHLEF